MTITFSAPLPDCAPCCAPACEEDGTLMDLTLAVIVICGCAIFIGGATILYNVVSDPDDLLGVWEDIPLGTPTVITTMMIQVYEDECTTPDGDPLEAAVSALITCADGQYTVSVTFECITPDGTITGELFQATGDLDTSLSNLIACIGSSTHNLPFVIDSAEVSLAA